ncbi:MAG TPA: 30S ribosome-binding factor RbfA [Bryobacteraceae bacterium]|nr:30S ribosome-binding factor RbfA [Bryobacteraceae bacterium]
MDPRRSERLSEALRSELEEILQYELTDPRIDVANVAEVLISPDGKHARVRLNLNGDRAWQEQTLEALDHAKTYIKRELTHRLDIFRLPEIRFEAALSADMPGRVDSILRRVRRGRPRDGETEKKPAE